MYSHVVYLFNVKFSANCDREREKRDRSTRERKSTYTDQPRHALLEHNSKSFEGRLYSKTRDFPYYYNMEKKRTYAPVFMN